MNDQINVRGVPHPVEEFETFKDHPRSIGEARSDRSQKCYDWTPREALVAMLRRIDAGYPIKDLVIVYGGALVEDAGRTVYGVGFSAAGRSELHLLGMIEQAKLKMVGD